MTSEPNLLEPRIALSDLTFVDLIEISNGNPAAQ